MEVTTLAVEKIDIQKLNLTDSFFGMNQINSETYIN